MAEAAAAPGAAASAPELVVVSLDDVLGALSKREVDALEHPGNAEHAAAHANDAAALAARALVRCGALGLTLPPNDAEALRAALRAAEPLYPDSTSDAPLTTHLDGGYALFQHRSRTATMPAALDALADRAHARLDGAGRALLRALSAAPELDTTLNFCDVAHPLSRPVAQLDSLLKPPGAPCYRRLRKAGSPSLDNASILSFFCNSPRADSVPCTYCNMLTLVYAEQAGREVRLHGSDSWTAPAPAADTVLVFVGECLQLATGNMMRACAHRVAPAAVPRASLVMSIDADPEAPLPLVFGRFWRCDTVGKFNVRIEALKTSEPAPQFPTVREPAASFDPSVAEVVLALPELAAAIVGALGNDFKGLAAAELVCAALRDAVAPHWHRLCLVRLGPLLASTGPAAARLQRLNARKKNVLLEPAMPQCIVASDARQWCALFYCLTTKLVALRIVSGHAAVVYFQAAHRTRWGQTAAAYCTKTGLDRALLQFSFNGRLILDSETIQELQLPQDAVVNATMVQAGA